MRKFKTVALIITVIAVLVIIKFVFFPKKNQAVTGPPPKVPVTVGVYVVKPEILQEKVFANGTILANEQAELRPEMSGKIVQLNLTEGAKVQKGDLIVKINDADFQAQLKKVISQIKLADEKIERQKKLLDIQGISKEEFDASQNQLTSLKADQEVLRAQIAKTEIRAPFDGVVGLKNVSEGAFITAQDIIASIQQTDPVKIDFSIPERFAGNFKKDETITFNLGEEKYSAKIYAVSPNIDLATRTLQIRAITKNAEGVFHPGAFVNVELALEENARAIMIPTESVVPDLKGKKVFLVKNSKAVPQKIETGLRTENKVEVISGLQEGDTIISAGIMQVKPEGNVKIVSVK